MSLPFSPPLEPMLSKAVDDLPDGDEWIFEPKWDGFRTLVFRDGDDVYLQSRDSKPMMRYFPELLPLVRAQTPERCILDGEMVIALLEGENVTLKKLYREGGGKVRLLPANARMKPIFVDQDALKVQGVVIGVLRRY